MTDEKPRSRASNGASSIYRGKDSRWHGRVTMGVRDDGRPDRRHVEAKTRAEVTRKVRLLEKERDAGTIRRPGKAWTVDQWLNHWLDTIAAPFVRSNTLDGYRVAVRVHLIPGVGAHRLDRLEPEHLERLYARMLAAGKKPATAHQAHRTISTALTEAVRRGHLARNPAQLAKAPRPDDDDIEPYGIDDIQRILTAAASRRNSTRWALALALGLRQGEALGLRWSDVDFETGTLLIRRGRQRPRYRHGCGGTCGKAKGGYCPQRISERADTAETKSRNGRRAIGLPDQLLALLRAHRQVQDRERLDAAQLWQDGDWVFTTEVGRPLNPRTDYDEWKRLLRLAGVRDGRLHDARHTAATVLLLLGVPERAVMGLMGWSNSAMTTRYQHLTAAIRRDIADRLGGLLWGTAEPVGEQDPGEGDHQDDQDDQGPAEDK